MPEKKLSLEVFRKKLHHNELAGENLSGLNLSKIYFRGANLQGTVFDSCQLMRANFSGCDLSGASFKDANLTNADLSNTELYETNFDGSDVSNVNFYDCNPTDISAVGIKFQDTNPLHVLLSNPDTTPAILFVFLNFFESDCLMKMAKSVNDSGMLPYELIDSLEIPVTQKEELQTILLEKMTATFKCHDELLDVKTVVHAHIDKSDELHANLTIAVELLNTFRQRVSISTSHPDVRQLSLEDRMLALATLTQTRENFVAAQNKIYETAPECRYYHRKASLTYYTPQDTMRVPLSHLSIQRILETSSEVILASSPLVANCSEYALLIKHALPSGFNSEIFTINGNAHFFVVIGDNPACTFKKFKRFGKNDVVCDALLGEVYPANEFLKKMYMIMTVEYQGNPVDIDVAINPNFHVVKLYDSYKTAKFRPSILIQEDFNIEKNWPALRDQIKQFSFYKPKVESKIKNDFLTHQNTALL